VRLLWWCRGPESNWLRPPFQGGALPVSYPGTLEFFNFRGPARKSQMSRYSALFFPAQRKNSECAPSSPRRMCTPTPCARTSPLGRRARALERKQRSVPCYCADSSNSRIQLRPLRSSRGRVPSGGPTMPSLSIKSIKCAARP
jgi:hypothetical protein